jgi:hypothetical protein
MIASSGASKTWQQRRWRRARLYRLGLKMEDYETKYLYSPHWRAFRELALDAQKKRLGRNICERCSTDTSERFSHELHIHHRTYERLGEERLEDVEILCRECHDKIHLRDPRSRARNRSPGYER